ncbi:MAG: glycosyltransferase family 39 protein [Patescibacteria group bacterium]
MIKFIQIIKSNKYELITWAVLLPAFLLTRLVNLKVIPIFTDEAIYSYWAQVALHDPANRYISLEDGKQPLFIWIAAVFQFFIKDPLVATRLVSVLSGFLALIGIYLLAREIFNKTSAKIAALIYILIPLTLLYDRMGLFDSLLAMLGIWAVFFSIKVAKNGHLDNALLNGFAIGLATITKSSGNFFLYLLPFSLVFFPFKSKGFLEKIFKWIFFTFVTIALSQIIYNSLRLSPLFYLIARKNQEFIRPLSEVINEPFKFFVSNTHAITEWLVSYVGIPLFLIFLTGLAIGVVTKDKRIFYLGVLIFAPFFAEALFNKVLYPRFVLFYFPYIILVIACAFDYLFTRFLSQKNIIAVVLIFALLQPAIKSFKLLTDPPSAGLVDADASQYLNSWPAGYGVDEVLQFIRSKSQDKAIFIGTEGTFGLFPFSLNIYNFNNPKVQIRAYWPVNPSDLPKEVTEISKKMPTYFVFNENQHEINNSSLKLIQKIKKGSGESYMRLYQVIPR